jgi:hypothetical protein
LIHDGGSHLEVCGIPGKIGIRVGSAIAQPQVLHWLAEATASFFPNISREGVQHVAATNTPEQLRTRTEKIHMTPAELATLFGGFITPTAPLGLLLIPVFDLDIEETRLVRAEPEQAIRMLMNCYAGLLSKGEGFLLHFFDISDARLEERLATLLGKHLPGWAPMWWIRITGRMSRQPNSWRLSCSQGSGCPDPDALTLVDRRLLRVMCRTAREP